MKLYIGVLLIIVGALIIIASYFIPGAVDNNFITVGGLAIIIVGLVAHILLNKYSQEAPQPENA